MAEGEAMPLRGLAGIVIGTHWDPLVGTNNVIYYILFRFPPDPPPTKPIPPAFLAGFLLPM